MWNMFPHQIQQSVEALAHFRSLAKKEITLVEKLSITTLPISKRLKSSILMPSNPILIPLGRVINNPETFAGLIIWRNWGDTESVLTGESSILNRLFQW
jgi:hypothetical protein